MVEKGEIRGASRKTEGEEKEEYTSIPLPPRARASRPLASGTYARAAERHFIYTRPGKVYLVYARGTRRQRRAAYTGKRNVAMETTMATLNQ